MGRAQLFVQISCVYVILIGLACFFRIKVLYPILDIGKVIPTLNDAGLAMSGLALLGWGVGKFVASRTEASAKLFCQINVLPMALGAYYYITSGNSIQGIVYGAFCAGYAFVGFSK